MRWRRSAANASSRPLLYERRSRSPPPRSFKLAWGRLARASEALGEDWRITAGGKAGRPTPTKDLVAMAGQAHAEIVKAEEMVLKAARLALDERKAAVEMNEAPGFTYSGTAEGIAIPQNLVPADREALRALMGNLTKYVGATRQARQAITVAAEVADGRSMPPDQPASQGTAMADPLAMTTTPISRRRRRRPA
jgi:ATP-dependent exoDNAse (exonuclease V) alpha subunit